MKTWEPERLLRDQHTVTAGTSDVQLVGPNPKRKAIIIDGLVQASGPFQVLTQILHNASVAALGNVLTYTTPANAFAEVTYTSGVLTGGAPATVVLNQTVSGNTVQTLVNTGNWFQNLDLVMPASSAANLNVTVVGAAGTMDLSLQVKQYNAPARATLSFLGPAVLDNGINIYSGTLPLIILDEWAGIAIQEEIHVIANVAGTIVSFVELIGT
jgi:hypothetical protein